MPRKIYTSKNLPDFSSHAVRFNFIFPLDMSLCVYKKYLRDNEWFTKTSDSIQETFCILVWLSENT
jgi:hypothetical protein